MDAIFIYCHPQDGLQESFNEPSALLPYYSSDEWTRLDQDIYTGSLDGQYFMIDKNLFDLLHQEYGVRPPL